MQIQGQVPLEELLFGQDLGYCAPGADHKWSLNPPVQSYFPTHKSY